jgi:spore germination protein
MKKLVAIPLILCCLLLNGCWDKIEIDKRIFISTIGIDGGKDLRKEKEKQEIKEGEPFGEREIEKLKVTLAFPDISQYSPEGGQVPEDKILSLDAYSMEDAVDKATAKSSRNIELGHARLLLISSEVMNYPETVKEFIDFMARHPRMNRVMHVVITEGRTEDFMNIELPMEGNLENYLSGLMVGGKTNASVLPVTLNELLRLLSQNGNAIVPSMKIDKEKGELKLSGTAIIKDYELQGFLSPTETMNTEMLRGQLKGGKRVIYKDEHPVDLQVDGMTRKISFDEVEGRLAFNVKVNLEGRLRGFYLDKNIFSREEISEIEKLFNNALSEEAEKVVRLLQREFEVDPIGFREYLEKYHPRVWKRVEKNWDDTFKSASVNVEVDTKIRRVGVSK